MFLHPATILHTSDLHMRQNSLTATREMIKKIIYWFLFIKHWWYGWCIQYAWFTRMLFWCQDSRLSFTLNEAISCIDKLNSGSIALLCKRSLLWEVETSSAFSKQKAMCQTIRLPDWSLVWSCYWLLLQKALKHCVLPWWCKWPPASFRKETRIYISLYNKKKC